MIDAPALVGFVAIAETGSVHAAARRLNVSQAALSRRLQRLEKSLRVDLFIRQGRDKSYPVGLLQNRSKLALDKAQNSLTYHLLSPCPPYWCTTQPSGKERGRARRPAPTIALLI